MVNYFILLQSFCAGFNKGRLLKITTERSETNILGTLGILAHFRHSCFQQKDLIFSYFTDQPSNVRQYLDFSIDLDLYLKS